MLYLLHSKDDVPDKHLKHTVQIMAHIMATQVVKPKLFRGVMGLCSRLSKQMLYKGGVPESSRIGDSPGYHPIYAGYKTK